jgi:hypothetical protein
VISGNRGILFTGAREACGYRKLLSVVSRQSLAPRKQSLILVRPETVVQWHRSGFKLYWRVLSRTWRPRGGKRRISKEIRDLILKRVAGNPTWGAPRMPEDRDSGVLEIETRLASSRASLLAAT